MKHGGNLFPHMGHEKEPPQPHGPKVGGKHPPVHSHSVTPKRTVGKKTYGKAKHGK